MRTGVLVDTGPLVAYLWSADRYHEWAVEHFASLDLPFITCEPVITEACFVTARNRVSPRHVLETVTRGVVQIGLQIDHQLAAVRPLLAPSAHLPLSLPPASLARLPQVH